MMTVAVVEDEQGIRDAVVYALEQEGYRPAAYRDGAAALAAWERGLPDIIVLDILMPQVGGLELCRRVRQRSEEIPIVFLTSRGDEVDRVLGLELGADDYLCKPFSMRELMARVHALERRLRQLRSREPEFSRETVVAGPLELDPGALRCRWKSHNVALTVTEFRLLEVLIRNRGVVLSRDRLLDAAYPQDVYVTERSIDSHVRRIRRKFLDVDGGFAEIDAVYGAGYRYRTGEQRQSQSDRR